MDIQKITKQILKDRGWTQDRLAREVGIHPVTLCRLLQNPFPPKSAYDKLLSYILELTGGPEVAKLHLNPAPNTQPEEQ